MLEGWTALGFLAALTKRARLGLMVGGVHYRLPGLWVKAATTLDVLSGGRAWLGIGAAWNQEESEALGIPVSATRRTLRDARGDAPDRPRDVDRRTRIRGGVHGTPVQGRPAPQLPAVDLAAPAADHDRGRWRTEDAAPRRPVRRRDQRLRRPGGDPPQVRGAPRALRGDRSRSRRDRALDAAERQPRRASRPPRSSTVSANSPTPEPST